MNARLAVLVAGLSLFLHGCALGPKAGAPVASYDFGPPSGAALSTTIKGLGGIEVAAPRWIDSTATHYRLNYAGAAQPLPYAQTRWVAPPPALIEARLKERAVAAGVLVGGTGPALRIEIDEFAQHFAAEKSSRGVLRARATLVQGREVLRQRQFVFEEAAATPDGPGGAAALGRSADRFIDAVLVWAGGG